MTVDALDPLIVPARLQIVATLAALPDGDALSFSRLQDMIGTPRGRAALDAYAATLRGLLDGV